MELIPSIDLRGGHCVRLFQGDFDAETHYDLEPPALLQRYRALGARWVHLVDLDGAREGQPGNRPMITELAATAGIGLQVGGGVRNRALVGELMAMGVNRIVVGSAAVESQSEVERWLKDFGTERFCLAFDVQLDSGGVPLLRTRGWREATAVSLWAAVEHYLPHGLRHVLCTDIARDGAMAGPNTPLYAEAVRRYPQLQWQASGGVSSIADLRALAATGVAVAISGKALLEDRLPHGELQPFLPGA